ncbi:MAG: glycosyltransferase [Alsobacter sp.]
MSRPTIVYDVVRLLLAARLPTPRGIDRIDYGMASRLFETWPGECVALMPTPWGLRLFERERVLRARSFFESRWPGETDGAPASTGPAGPERDGHVPARFGLQTWSAIPKLLRRTGLATGRPLRSLPAGSVLINAGHDSLSQGWMVSWLRQHSQVALLAMVHDLVPVLHPSLVSMALQRASGRLLAHVATYAEAALAPSRAVAGELSAAMAARGRPQLPIYARGLPIQDAFLGRPSRSGRPRSAFVVCGTLEPRKNVDILLDAWAILAERHGPSCPPLIVAGAVGWRGEASLARIAAAGRAVTWVPTPPTLLLRDLVGEAKALLMPSRAEGFGLPVAEALALGTPVIASDIPAHREAGGGAPLYVCATDPLAWVAAVEQLAWSGDALQAALDRTRAWRPVTWRDFMNDLGEIVDQVSFGPRQASRASRENRDRAGGKKGSLASL